MSFSFAGPLHSSKSLVNRLLILKNIYPELKLNYTSESEDVKNLEKLFSEFYQGVENFSVGEGGTTFRFFSLWISRQIGNWRLTLGKQLSQRPHDDLLDIFKQLGVEAYFADTSTLHIQGWLWETPSSPITVSLNTTTQFLTGLALAASSSKKEFQIQLLQEQKASGYDQLTWELLKKLGFDIKVSAGLVVVTPATAVEKEIYVGADWSSVFYLLMFAFVGANIKILNVDLNSPEPDLRGLSILQSLGLKFEVVGHTLLTKPSDLQINSRVFDFRKNPDLFPGFCALMTLLPKAEVEKGAIKILYPEQLQVKESDRLKNSLKVLDLVGFSYQKDEKPEEILLTNKKDLSLPEGFTFPTDHDHRMLMTAVFLQKSGWSISLQETQSYKKSFPEFWEITHG